jgi:uncharacterized protein
MASVIPALFTFVGGLCVLAIVGGLPGTWMLLAVAVLIELFDAHWLPVGANPSTFGWGILLGATALAALGEGLEVLSGMLGVKAGGGTKRGMWGSILGGLAGALGGTLILPIPVLGTIVGALLGTFLGALWGEMTSKEAPLSADGSELPQKRSARDAMKPALAATVSRALGTVAKTGIGATVWIVLSVAAFL